MLPGYHDKLLLLWRLKLSNKYHNQKLHKLKQKKWQQILGASEYLEGLDLLLTVVDAKAQIYILCIWKHWQIQTGAKEI